MSFHIVGIGASAGGLEALEAFFEHVPKNCGLAFVVVQHLSPDFRSVMDQLLARRTVLEVHRVEHGMDVRPGAVYLIPPKKDMVISGGRLLLSDEDPERGRTLPIDTFFRSLAEDAGDRAIAVVLSGTGSDGSRGIRDVHEKGGFVLVQSVESAKFDGMPKSALDTGLVDMQAPPEKLPEAILRYVSRSLGDGAGEGDASTVTELDAILSLLNREYGIDFSHYKPTTLHRRIERRLMISQTSNLEAYARSLANDRRELHQLYKDLLIGVTRFFRDADAFRTLKSRLMQEVLPRIAEGDELRAWVAGCATGEEAYSLAILLREAVEAVKRKVEVKIFATDVHAASLEAASAGLFSPESLEGMDASRLQRYFTRGDDGFRVSQELRQMIVFAPHNLLNDAPFTKLDLITCRNLLIYLDPQAQKKLLTMFHFALKPRGLLLLGMSETPGDLAGEFETVDLHARLFRKARDVRLPHDVRLARSPMFVPPIRGRTERAAESDRWLEAARNRLLEQFTTPSLLVDQDGTLVHAFAGGGKFLTHGDGRSTLCVLDLVPPELKLVLNGALQRAAKEGKTVEYLGVPYKSPDGPVDLRLTVTPLALEDDGPKRYLISLESRSATPAGGDGERIDMSDASRERIARLEEELQSTRENLQATLEEIETSNEELQATNEELVASNEELQATNEELQSVNEELYTVNSEYQRKIVELTELNADVDNLLAATDVGTIFLDADLRVRKFTPQIAELFHLTPADIGRRLESFAHTLDDANLLDEVENVRSGGLPVQREVCDRGGVWYLLRVLPYRKPMGQVEGVVISLVDISLLKKSEERLRRMSRVFQDGADPIIVEDLNGVIIDANDEAARAYGYTREELIGRPMTMLVPPECRADTQRMRALCLQEDNQRNIEGWRLTKDGKRVPVLLTLSLLTDESHRPVAIATIAKEVTRLKEAEEAAREAVRRRDEFLALLSHELRNPLEAVLRAARVMRRSQGDPEALAQACDAVDRQGWHMARLLDDLLDVSRVTSGKIRLEREVVDLRDVVATAAESLREMFDEKQHVLVVNAPDRMVCVYGDRARLRQIVENLLHNAAKYTPDWGRIVVTIETEEVGSDGDKRSEAVVRVEDNGQGIEAEMLSQVFDMFTQSERTLARSGGGMGVGLTLVRNLVEMHDGQVHAKSDGPGLGSEFIVRLPLAPQRPSPPPRPADYSEAELPPQRVLIIEDNDDARTMLAKLLQLDGHEVTQAVDGETGLEALYATQPDIALVDVGLPKIDGYEVARRARANPALSRTLLVAVTGYGQESDHQAILDAGFDEHLIKPVKTGRLLTMLARRAKPR